MTFQWKNTAAATVMAVSLLAAGIPAYAEDSPSAVSQEQMESYSLTDQLQVVLKGVVNERVDGGVRVAAVIRMTNTGGSVTRVPDNYEVRVKTADGVEYTLTPSAANPKAVQPKATIDLNYLSTLDLSENITLTELSWVDVDEYVYPKTETPVLTLDITGQSWSSDAAASGGDVAAAIAWGETFSIPDEESPLRFSAVDLTNNTGANGPVTVVKVLAENPTDKRVPVPDFAIDGQADTKSYPGSKIETGTVYVEAGSEQYVHFAIPTDADALLTGLTVATHGSFVQAGAAGAGAGGAAQAGAVNFTIGKLSMSLPQTNPADEQAKLPIYQYGDPIYFDPVSKLIDPNLKVAMADLRFFKNDGAGYQTAVAKFTLTNGTGDPIALPNLTAELDATDGSRYLSGTANAGTAQQPGASAVMLMPGTSNLVSYTFLLPETVAETGNLSMKLLDAATVAPYTSSIAAFKVVRQIEELNSDPISFYPLDVKIKDWNYNGHIATNFASYNYTFKLNLEIAQKDNVVLSQNLSKLEVELVDSTGKSMASQKVPFVGTGKLVDGWQTIEFTNVGNQLEGGVTVNLYESVDMADGPVRRLVAQFHP
jgi:hypothetical protein